ncbi:MAG TPA: N-acetylmuramoyl-L-alanine amidase [Acidimicrobiales bacterium]|nr:N-acetylmuramoyl-L-alanine amidase [Acidimicrobiales bacterium]
MSTLTDPLTGEKFSYLTRAEWGARPPKYRNGLASTANGVFMHHTVTSIAPAASIWRAVQNFHMDTRGWADVAYSFGIDVVTGQILEGRGIGIAGGHTAGYNSSSHAICWIANTDDVNPTAAAKRAWLAVLHTIEARYGNGPERGHRDVAQTGCPGGYGYTWLKAGFPTSGSPGEPPPPPPPPPPSGTRVLAKGMVGDDVKQWQTRLAGRGYWIAADGAFGDLTEGVTKWFQEGRKIDVDGKVGPQTLASMTAAEKENWKPSLGGPVKPTPPATAGPPWPGRYLKRGMSGNDVRVWQARMKQRGWNLAADGQYGPASESVCQKFQAEKRLGVDGIVGPATWDATFNSPIT